MKLLILHNRYQQPGGEDVAVQAEAELLRARGHQVSLVEVDNRSIAGTVRTAAAALATPYNFARRRWAAELVRSTGAELVHVHNTLALLSPAVFDGACDAGAAVVHTLHNYRSICAGGLLLRDGRPCDACVGRHGTAAIRHRCYRASRAGSAAIVAMQQVMRRRGAWDRPGRRLIALSDFARARFIAGGLPGDRITVKPNSVDLAAVPDQGSRSGLVYAGRLSREKGVGVLIEAARRLPGIQVTLIGDGPEAERLRQTAPPNVSFTGALPRDATRARIARARLLVLPSLWYEGLPMTLLEGFAAATPVIASRVGALGEWIEDGVTGALVPPGDAAALAARTDAMLADPHGAAAIGRRGRRDAEARFSPEANGAALERIYASALAELHG